MKKSTIEKIIKHLTAIKEAGISIKKYQELNNLSDKFIYNKITNVETNKDNISEVDYSTIMNLYSSIKSPKFKSLPSLEYK